MKIIKKITTYFSKVEILLWSISTILIISSFILFNSGNYLGLIVSLIGVTALIFNARGNPIGQFLMIIFSIIYGIISYNFKYYGEMLTYVGMSMPMAIFSLISWLKHPYNGNSLEVKVNKISKKEFIFMFLIAIIVTGIFYFILDFFKTPNIIPSTISVTTSFIAVYLTFRRSPYYAIGYAANDIVLIILWSLATIENVKYLSLVVCFSTFLANDLYGFYSWRKMSIKQNANLS